MQEERIDGKASAEDVTTNNTHLALSTSLSAAVRTNTEGGDRRGITL